MSNIAFLKTPPQLSLTGNPISFRIAGKNAFTGNLTKPYASFYISGSTPWAVGTYLSFAWGGKTVVFECTASPSDSALEFPSTTSYSVLVGYLKKSADLVKDFDISYGVNNITLWAREIGEQYNLVITSDWSAGFSAFPPTDNTEHQLAGFYKIGIDIEKNYTAPTSTSNNKLTVNMEFPVSSPESTDTLPGGFTEDATGVIQADISELLKETVNGSFTFPEPDEGFHAVHNLVKNFRIYAYERLEDNNIGLFSDLYYYLQGKLSAFSQGNLNFLEKSFYDLLTESNMFLTNAPLEKITDIYAPEKLYFLFTAAGTYRLVSKEYYSDGTTATTVRETITPAKWDVYEFFVSYAKIRTNAPKKVTKYEIYIINQYDAKISDTRTFVIDYTYQPYARYFLLKNSFGVYEIFRSTGKVAKSLSIGKDIVKIPLSDTFTDTDKEEIQIATDSSTLYKINSGYLPNKYWADWLQEFLTSEDVYWLKKSKPYPVTINESKNQLSADGDYNPYQEFELSHSLHDDFTEEFNTAEPILIGDFNFDFNTDFFTGGTGEAPVDPSQLFADEFDDFTGNVPTGWTVEGEAPVVSDNDGAVVIAFTSGDLYTKASIIRPNAFSLADPPAGMNWMQVKVTINIDSLSAGDQAMIEFCQNADGSGFNVQELITGTGEIEKVMLIPMSFVHFRMGVINITGNTNHSVIVNSLLIQDLYQYTYIPWP